MAGDLRSTSPAAGGDDIFRTHTTQVLLCGNKSYMNIVRVLAKTEQHMHTEKLKSKYMTNELHPNIESKCRDCSSK